MKKENWFKDFYNTLLKVGQKLNKEDNHGKFIIIRDLLILMLVICFFKIPFIFIRDILESVFNIVSSENTLILALIGLILEIAYIILALIFFKRTLKRYIDNNKENKKNGT